VRPRTEQHVRLSLPTHAPRPQHPQRRRLRLTVYCAGKDAQAGGAESAAAARAAGGGPAVRRLSRRRRRPCGAARHLAPRAGSAVKGRTRRAGETRSAASGQRRGFASLWGRRYAAVEGDQARAPASGIAVDPPGRAAPMRQPLLAWADPRRAGAPAAHNQSWVPVRGRVVAAGEHLGSRCAAPAWGGARPALGAPGARGGCMANRAAARAARRCERGGDAAKPRSTRAARLKLCGSSPTP
jgi:hypothetical protein